MTTIQYKGFAIDYKYGHFWAAHLCPFKYIRDAEDFIDKIIAELKKYNPDAAIVRVGTSFIAKHRLEDENQQIVFTDKDICIRFCKEHDGYSWFELPLYGVL